MFSCNACLRRALTNLSLDQPSLQTANTSHFRLRTRRRVQHRASTSSSYLRSPSYVTTRSHATYDSLSRGHHRRVLRKALKNRNESPESLPPPNARRKGPNAFTKGEIKDAMARTQNRENQLVKNDDDDRQAQRKMKKEIEQYHSDPVQLAHAVQSKLRIPDFGAALNMVRASDGIVSNNVVSWNHLIDHCMSHSDTHKAWKVYNELKKRGHKPDAHTYTIMLRGLGQNIQQKDVSERAVGIYNSMFAPNSGVVPNTIHTNAVLNVCARKGDMDGLWAIAGRLPDSGAGAPDRWTFTTILNAVRENATARVAELIKEEASSGRRRGRRDGEHIDANTSVEQQQKVIFDQALSDGRKLWGDVSFRWRRADLIVDEPLVCAMGRLILGCGTRRDFGEVFDLVDQSMNTRVKGRKRRSGGASQVLQVQAPGTIEGEQEGIEEETEIEETRPALPLDESIIYANPSNNTLSMLMEAAIGLKDMKSGKAYWNLLTDPQGRYKVQPDAQNVISYLRLLRISRASVTALEVLSQYWPNNIAERLYKRGTFVVAMSTCIRDKNSPIVFETADKLLTLMQAKLEEADLGMFDASIAESELDFKERLKRRKERVKAVDETFGEEEGQAEIQRRKQGVESLNIDPKALRMYIDLSILTTKGWNEGLKYKDDHDEIFERDPKKNNVLRAMKRIAPMVLSIRRLAKMKIEEMEIERLPRPKSKVPVKFEKSALVDRAGTRVAERLEDLIDLLRSLVSAYDRIIMMADRFEDHGVTPLDEAMIARFRTDKRMVSGFLSRTKDEIANVTASRNQYRDREEDEEDEDAEIGENDDADESKPYERKITRQLRTIQSDTSRDLANSAPLSRRQRNERTRGVQQRMNRRLPSSDYGVVGSDLRIQRNDHRDGGSEPTKYRRQDRSDRENPRSSLERMRSRAEGIDVKGQGQERKWKQENAEEVQERFEPWGRSGFRDMEIEDGGGKGIVDVRGGY